MGNFQLGQNYCQLDNLGCLQMSMNVQQSEATVLGSFFFLSFQKFVHKTKCSLQWLFHEAQKAEGELLKSWILWIWSLRKSYYFIFTFGLIASIRREVLVVLAFHVLDHERYVYMVPGGNTPQIWLWVSMLRCDSVFYLCGKIALQESFKTSRKSF